MNDEGFIFFDFFKLVMLSQSLRNPVDQLKTPLNPAGFRLTLAPNVAVLSYPGAKRQPSDVVF